MKFSSRIAAGFAAAVLVAALGGCATAPDESPTATPPPAPAPTSTPTESAPEPGDPDAWTATDGAIGPIALDTPFPDAMAELPDGSQHDEANCPWAAWWNSPEDYQLVVARDSAGSDDDPVLFVQAIAPPGTTAAVGPRTSDGLGIGSSLDEVEAAHPDAEYVDFPSGPIEGGPRFVKAGDTLFFTYYDDDAVVTGVSVTTEATPPYELCG